MNVKFGTKHSRRSFIFSGLACLAWVGATVRHTATAVEEEIAVRTVEEFFRAIGPNRTIKLAPGSYQLSNLSPVASEPYVSFEEAYDGYELIVSGVENLKIVGQGERPPRLVTEPRYGEVLRFRNCQNITLENIEAGHWPQKGFCQGGVLDFSECEKIDIENCILFGSGIEGIRAIAVNDLTCKNTVIKECTYHILTLSDCNNVLFTECLFHDNQQYDLVNVFNSRNVQFQNCEFRYNFSQTVLENFLFNIKDSDPVLLTKCLIQYNNVTNFVTDPTLLELIETTLKNNTFQRL